LEAVDDSAGLLTTPSPCSFARGEKSAKGMASSIQQRLEVEAKAFQQFQKGANQNKDPAVIHA